MDLFWQYTTNSRFHWIEDNKYYRLKKPGMTYEHKRWAIVNCTPQNLYNQQEGEGYDLWHKGKKIKHAKTSKELKLYVEKHENKYDNRVHSNYFSMMCKLNR